MNFFKHQDTAKHKTTLLVVLLSLAVLSLVAITIAAIGLFLYYVGLHSTSVSAVQAQQLSLPEHMLQFVQTELALWVSLGVVFVVGMGTVFKYAQLSGGGRKVAEALGGKLLNYDGAEGEEAKVLNIVEEMAIASGNPVPPVYIIEDNGINAFAAGLSRRDAVIGVTRGCVNLLNRDELQGVIAHEFSHIHNGDMRLNMRLIAILHGILVIGLLGYYILRGSGGYHYGYGYRRRYSGGSNSKSRGAQMGLGFALVAIGFGGTFFGNIIKAAVSRQREFLADASAVQFTRNPEGIGNALKKIGGFDQGSLISNGAASQFSHMFFGQGIKTSFNALMATHPPLHERIRKVLPNWNGGYIHAEQALPSSLKTHSTNATNIPGASAFAAAGSVSLNASSIETIGEPQQNHLEHAHALLASIPQTLRDAAHQPFSARALIYCLLLDSQKEIRTIQARALKDAAHPATFKVMQNLYRDVNQLPREHHIALIEMSIPALKLLSAGQYQVFKNNLSALIKADNQVSLFEWCVYRIVTQNSEARVTESKYRLRDLPQEISLLFSLVVQAGKSRSPGGAFQKGIENLGFKGVKFTLSASGFAFPEIDTAIEKLSNLKVLQKPVLLKALVEVINADSVVTPVEAELFRAIADSLDCPVPPLNLR